MTVILKNNFGFIVKAASIIFKILFIFVLSPYFPEGVFGEYFTILTTSLIISRLLSLGCSEQLPLLIRSDPAAASRYTSLGVYLLIFLVLFISTYQIFENKILLLFILSISFTVSSVFSGVLRSINHNSFEVAINLPWAVQFLLSTLYVYLGISITVNGLIYILVISRVISVFISIFISKVHLNFSYVNAKQSFLNYLKNYDGAIKRVISNLAQVFQLRGFILVGYFLLEQQELDAMAYAISISEAAWQLAMVNINKFYSENVGNKKLVTLNINVLYFPFIIILMSTIFVFSLKQFGLFYFITNKFEYYQVFYCMIIALSTIVWSYYKYFSWIIGHDSLVLNLELALISILFLSSMFFGIAFYSIMSLSYSLILMILLLKNSNMRMKTSHD
ncbi:hypothetical protein [Vibrio alginolyticus]|uniref:hypothetical protein n=1 Tax=Vibrio alginolyticus TaxID=663 RepID=UPI001EFD3C97|nr:hypothetical protein [Vibrio alginolyticus]MCG9744012.1 hypothetical protein [Vibrio alginolyticus]